MVPVWSWLVRVNAVSPSIVQTPVDPAGSYEALAARLGRGRQVSDVVDGVLFLEASARVTGRSSTSIAARSPATDTE